MTVWSRAPIQPTSGSGMREKLTSTVWEVTETYCGVWVCWSPQGPQEADGMRATQGSSSFLWLHEQQKGRKKRAGE